MRQIALMIAVSCAVSPLAAAETRVLRGAEVLAALEGRKRVQGSGARRYWEVRDVKCCSARLPSDLWARYAQEGDGAAIRFLGGRGDITAGRYSEE